MKVTRINPNTLTVQLDQDSEAAVVSRRGPAAQFINCGSEEAQRYLWDHLERLAEPPSFEDQLFEEETAERWPWTAKDIPMLVQRIEALENADKCNDTAHQHLQKLIRNLETRHETLQENASEAIDGIKHDIDSHGRQLEDLENAAETAEPAAVDKEEVESMIKEHIEEHERQYSDGSDDAHIHDLIATYIIDDDAGTLRRKVVGIVADKLLGR